MTASENSKNKKSVRLKVSPRVARLVSGDAGCDEQVQALRGHLDLNDVEWLTLLVYFGQRADRELLREVRRALDTFPEDRLRLLAADNSLQLPLLGFLAKRYAHCPTVADALLTNSALPAALRSHLRKTMAASSKPVADEDAGEAAEEAGASQQMTDATDQNENPAETQPEDEEPEGTEKLSKFQMAMQMGVAEKIKAAMTGDKEWRSLLISDSNKLVSSAVLKNPRITEGEVQTIARSKSTNDELIRIILLNREWVKNYSIKLALVLHPRTPIGNALRFMGFLTEKDLKNMVKSREISPVIVNNARRILMAKSKRS
ncbi:hypothetical protein Pcar_1968 [Syntrophotalea carbinolica DSM 2380]|uniref:Uncharacterized protein n=1 Tax=Syntrophotalea carbinolica (strain DSM 2380 / NBRC 103641 / GraBd1) TaxID=338963 RepID=Q3A348_SYNC1|nr:hypothetical protein [Syntrophotalea carbinolica]ABA89209.1 hypothetical protein Pcar_1968 [Syntrophotalea carbinolica DSM 2380]